MDTLENFKSELSEGDIRFRDNFQFELKSEFFINPNFDKSNFKQEFYLFIPEILIVNEKTYSKERFYLNETNFIRYKTPQFSLKDLIDSKNQESPLTILLNKVESNSPIDQAVFSDDLKLFGNIFKTSLRDQINFFIKELEKDPENFSSLKKTIQSFCLDIIQARNLFSQLRQSFFEKFSQLQPLCDYFDYTDEFISETIEYYMTWLLKILRDTFYHENDSLDSLISQVIEQEQAYRETHHLKSPNPISNESILYREGLLNKFIAEPLFLITRRTSKVERYGDILAAFAAGFAMLIYLVLLAVNGLNFVLNSFPIILLIAVLYMIKDRVKEGLKKLYYNHAFRWFPDYSNEIRNQKGEIIGRLNESFTFLDEASVPQDILKARNIRDSNEELPSLKRLETVIRYKRDITLYNKKLLKEKRVRGLTFIFRLNIQNFLEKGSNPLLPVIALEKDSHEIIERLYPKVYHINIVIKNLYQAPNKSMKSQIKRFRIVADKLEILRVEHIKKSG